MPSVNRQGVMFAFVLAIWIYLKTYLALTEMFLDPVLISYVYYVILSVLTIFTIFIGNLIIKKKVLLFYLVYIIIVIVNSMVVDYTSYVLIEGLTSFVIFIVPIYIISNVNFNFHTFLDKWFSIATFNSFLLIIYIYLYSKGMVNYGSFAGLALPNIIILSYITSLKRCWDLFTMFLICFNVLVTIVLGGRMAAVSAIFTVVLCMLISQISLIKKVMIAISVVTVLIVSVGYLENIVTFSINILNGWGLSPRTLNLLSVQLNQGGLFENVYMTNRDTLYDMGLFFVKSRYGLPGGFAVMRDLTGGQYYHAHNLLLELVIFFGVMGTVLIASFIIRSAVLIRRKEKDLFLFCIIIGGFYGVYSLSGTNFLDSFASILLIAILFFYETNKFIRN